MVYVTADALDRLAQSDVVDLDGHLGQLTERVAVTVYD